MKFFCCLELLAEKYNFFVFTGVEAAKLNSAVTLCATLTLPVTLSIHTTNRHSLSSKCHCN
jgi:hypothetical protein